MSAVEAKLSVDGYASVTVGSPTRDEGEVTVNTRRSKDGQTAEQTNEDTDWRTS